MEKANGPRKMTEVELLKTVWLAALGEFPAMEQLRRTLADSQDSWSWGERECACED